MKRLLPLGSVIILNDENKSKVMVVARLVRQAEEGKVYDYLGCLVPVGIQTLDEVKFFDSDMIKRLLFIGYQDEDEIKYSYQLSKIDVNKI